MVKNSEKDPNKPKRAMTGFMYFSKALRPEVLKLNPDIKFAEVGKELGRLWKELTDDDKVKYMEQANVDKERYIEAMKHYVPPPQFTKQRRKKKKSDMPKRAMSAYLYFCKAHRDTVKAENPELKMVAVQTKLGKLWQECGETDRIPFQKQAQADRARYEAELIDRKAQYEAAALAAEHD